MQRGNRTKRAVLLPGLLCLLLLGCGKTGSRTFPSIEVMKNDVIGMYKMNSGDTEFIMEITGDDKINIYTEDLTGKSKNLGTYTATWSPKNGSLLMKGETLEKEIFVLENGSIQNEENTYVRIEDDDAESLPDKDEGSAYDPEKDEDTESVSEQVKSPSTWFSRTTESNFINSSESYLDENKVENLSSDDTRQNNIEGPRVLTNSKNSVRSHVDNKPDSTMSSVRSHVDNKPDSTMPSSDGMIKFRGFEWGTDMNDVVDYLSKSSGLVLGTDYRIEDNMIFVANQSVAGLKCITVYGFDDLSNGLSCGVYYIEEQHTNEQLYYEDYVLLVEKMNSIYGPSSNEREIWNGDLFKNRNKEGMAIITGELTLLTDWTDGSGNTVTVCTRGDNYECSSLILYQSSNYSSSSIAFNIDGL